MSGAQATETPHMNTSPPPPIGDASNGLPFQPNESLPNTNNNNFITIEGIGQVPIAPAPITDTVRLNSGSNGNANGLGLGLTLMQSSPPPHSYRHSRAYRHFKNPPQPHMCIRTTTDAGEELFINVLSWTRIVIPQEPSDPIPLYGGMRVPPGSPRSPPIVFAVMANPEVLKDSGRHSKDPEERRAMVELMCDFVEAMNPGVKLVRNAVILKDRDISGELKDVWNAVQAQRDREREEQIMQQRQQQHYHNVTTQQMFPKSAGVTANKAAGATQESSQQEDERAAKFNGSEKSEAAIDIVTGKPLNSAATQSMLAQQLDNKAAAAAGGADNNNTGTSNGDVAMTITTNVPNGPKTSSLLQNGSCDQTDAAANTTEKTDKSNKGPKEDAKLQGANSTTVSNANNKDSSQQPQQQKTAINNSNTTLKTTPTSPTATGIATNNSIATPTTAMPPTPAPTPAPPTKKEKLGGFLPNGCIFPRFKNNKNKDKDKDKDKEKDSSKPPKEKEKTLLNALKKSKDKKVAPIEHPAPEKNTTVTETDAKTQYEKNCINLESEVEKLNLNKIDTSTNSDNMFIKLKVAATSAAATAK